VDGRFDVPTNKVSFLKFVGLVFDTGIVLEDELKNGCWTFLDEIDRYFYENILSILTNNDRL
jgi:hypothetical protein